MKLHPATYSILHFTPWARLRGPQDRFWPLFWSAVVLLVVIVYFLLRVEAEYREDARSVNAPPANGDARGEVLVGSTWSASPGAEVRGVKSGQPQLTF